MWTKLSHNIIKYRLPLIILLAIITAVMGYFGVDAEMTYSFSATVPPKDPQMVKLKEFRDEFGQDGTMVALGIQDSSLFTPNNFSRYKELGEELKKLDYVNEVIAVPSVVRLLKDTDRKKFIFDPIFKEVPSDQASLDSMLSLALDQRFFSDRLVNKENGAVMMLVSIRSDILNTKERITATNQIIDVGQKFIDDTGIQIRYAGLPFVRSVIAGQVSQELIIFLGLSVAATGFILLLFFRSWESFIFPMIIIAVVVVWVFGSIVILGYKVTILTALIPPLIVVIGIPNSVYLINKYHQEYEHHGNKIKAISRVTRKIGLVTLITNFTTAIGFLVLLSTDIVVLREFGIVAGLNILATFIVSIILMPAVFSWLPAPTTKQLRHLKFRMLDKVLTAMDITVHRYRIYVYAVAILLITGAVIGMYRINAVSYIVDDLPEQSTVIRDLRFFEDNFSGIMPLEIVVDTNKKRGVTDLRTMRKIDEFESFLEEQPEISKPVSLVSIVKASRQAFYNNNPDRYGLPSNNRERTFLLPYLQSEEDSLDLISNFVDSSLQRMRISLQVADVGSDVMEVLINDKIRPQIDSIFTGSDITVNITGTTPVFVRGNKFLIENLRFSLILAFIIISITMGFLFQNLRMILVSIIPNLIPLMMTAGIMGYFGIPLKPSTALIFSIAFGISVDDSIHYLAKYRQELFANNFFVPYAVSKSIRETGASMIYTSIILFTGFIIFAGSDFGGTVALGVLTSTTLFLAMITNLILLPSLIMTFDDGKRRLNTHPIIEQYDSEFYSESEDEEIDLGRLEVWQQAGNGTSEGSEKTG